MLELPICADPDGVPAPFIVGAPRSGTTLLRLMLDAHPDLAIPPETGFALLTALFSGGEDRIPERFFQALTQWPPEAPVWDDFGLAAENVRAALARLDPFTPAAGLRTFYRLYAARFGKRRWGDKTPSHAHHIAHLAALLPEARFIHLVRDGRDVAASLRAQWFAPGRDMALLARYWCDTVDAARAAGAGNPRYLEVRYEDLVRAPEFQLRRLCTFLELEFDPAMLRHHERAAARLAEHGTRRGSDGNLIVSAEQRRQQQAASLTPPDPGRIGAGRRRLNAAELAAFETVAGATLQACGYVLGAAE